jgi:hypothetical protein
MVEDRVKSDTYAMFRIYTGQTNECAGHIFSKRHGNLSHTCDRVARWRAVGHYPRKGGELTRKTKQNYR